MCIFRWETILTRVSPPSQKTIYDFKLVVGHTTKHMKHGRSCDIEIWWTRGWKCRTRAQRKSPLTAEHHLYNVEIPQFSLLNERVISTVAHKCQRPENPQHNSFKLLCCDFHNTTVFRQHNKMELLCCGHTTQRKLRWPRLTVTQKCQRQENPQHNNLKLLCCGFSGRWHLWATVH